MEFTLFCRKICFAAIYAVLSRNLFCRSLRTFCVETTYGQNVVRGEKMTNIMYVCLLKDGVKEQAGDVKFIRRKKVIFEFTSKTLTLEKRIKLFDIYHTISLKYS